eukprot:5199446-Prymnesium_polylepis.1
MPLDAVTYRYTRLHELHSSRTSSRPPPHAARCRYVPVHAVTCRYAPFQQRREPSAAGLSLQMRFRPV